MAGFFSFFRDGALANVLTGRGTSVDRSANNFWIQQGFNAQQIEAAYRGSWLTRQIVDIPAQDMTRAGRDWDADDRDIEKIEAEEKRLQVWAKVRHAIVYGRLGGGALFINLMDKNPMAPLPTSIRPEMIESLVPLHRTQITIGQMDDDLLSPNYGQPVDFRVNTSARPQIHSTRLILFKGAHVPQINFSSWEDRFWGDSIVTTVNEAVQQATTATSSFAALIDEAKVDVITFAGLVELLGQPGGEQKFMERLQVSQTGKSIHRMLALGEGDTWEQRQINWTGMPDVIKTYLSIVAGAADIPATRLLGKSPDGMNATGESDLANYFQSIGSQQEDDLRPALEQLDKVLLPSAGVTSQDLTWQFSPLMVLSKKEQSEIDAKDAETLSKLVNTGLFADEALEESYSNRMIESQRWPGYKDKRDEAAKAGKLDFDEPDPSDLVPTEGGGPGLPAPGVISTENPGRRVARSRAPKPEDA